MSRTYAGNMCSRARRRLWTTRSSPSSRGQRHRLDGICLVPVGLLVAEPIEGPVDLVIERGQCCRQLVGVKQGAEHQPGKGEQGARLQFGVNPPGEDSPAR